MSSINAKKMQNCTKEMGITRKLIKEYCFTNDISPAALEIKAGLSKDSVYSFLIGKVSDLKFSNASRIADTTGYSLDELAGRKTTLALYSADTTLNQALLKASLDFVLNYIKQHSLAEVKLRAVFSATDAVYDYSFKNQKESVDPSFSNWFCNNFFSNLN